MIEVAYVILHYQNIEETRACVNSIQINHGSGRTIIVIVDNASPNGTGKLLYDEYTDSEEIVVLKNKDNLGFAKGNNIGYIYAKNKHNPDFIVVMNNDVMIEQNDFIGVMRDTAILKEYEIILPDIVNKNGIHQNPYKERPLTDREIDISIRNKRILLALYTIPGINVLWNKTHEKKLHFGSKVANKPYTEMLLPHGSCVIYSKKWIEKENFAFVPETFMYGEEEILYEYVINRAYRTYFFPDLKVKHLEDMATSTVLKTNIKKAQFQLRNSLVAAKVLRKIRTANNEQRRFDIE